MYTPGKRYVASPRTWDGKLKSPEYDREIMEVRKVQPNGCISISQKDYYLGRALIGEYVGIKKENEDLSIYYGPVYLGNLREDERVQKPKRLNKKRA